VAIASLLHVTNNAGAGGLESILCDYRFPWAVGDYRLGDAIFFHGQTVHRPLPNQTEVSIRLSCDFRYQPVHDVIDPRSLTPHVPEVGWDELYGDWKRKELQYYWKNIQFSFSEWNEVIRWQKEKIC
jgi:hypothetical protein